MHPLQCVADAASYSLFFFSSRRRHTRCSRDWSSDVCSSDLHQPFVNDLEGFDGDFVPRGVEARAGPLGRPPFTEVPTHFLGARVIHEDDRAVLPLDLAVDDLLAPLPELCVVGDAPLERDVRVLDEPRQLARRVGLVALAVVHGILGGIETGALAEPGASDAVNLHQKAVGPVRVLAISDWHGSTSSMAIRVGPAR